MRWKNVLLASLGAAGGAALAMLYLRYRQARQTAVASLINGSQLIQIPQGVIEVSSMGEGPAVLMLHGGGAGYDLGNVFSFPEWGYRFLSVSRPGYLRTPIATGPTLDAQADAYAGLLDTLGIEDAVVVGMSGGGPAAVTFALRHPKRCRGLVLFSAIVLPISSFPGYMIGLTSLMKYFDFLPWLLTNTPVLDWTVGRKMLHFIGQDAEKMALYRALMKTTFPASSRIRGVIHELPIVAAMQPLPFEQITCPTLVIHARDDGVVPFIHAQTSASRIPKAQLLELPRGDHFGFIVNLEITKPAFRQFLESTKSRTTG